MTKRASMLASLPVMAALSSSRFSAHGPSNLMADWRPGISGARLRLADAEAIPFGHVTVLGALPTWLLWTIWPSTSSVALSASPCREKGVKVTLTDGAEPPEGKKALRISAASWKVFNVDLERSRPKRASCFQLQS